MPCTSSHIYINAIQKRHTVDVLGDGSKGEGCAKIERALEVGRHEGVVDNKNHARVLIGYLGNGLDVNNLKKWVRRRFDPHKLGMYVSMYV